MSDTCLAFCRAIGDGRRTENRRYKAMRTALVQQIGGKASPAQMALIEQVARLALRLEVMDRAFSRDGYLGEREARTYLRTAEVQTRMLQALGLRSPEPERRPLLERMGLVGPDGEPCRAPGPPGPVTAAGGTQTPDDPGPARTAFPGPGS